MMKEGQDHICYLLQEKAVNKFSGTSPIASLHMHAMVDMFNNNDEPRSQTTSSSLLLFTNREEDSMTTSGSVREQKGGGTENLTSLQHQQITI